MIALYILSALTITLFYFIIPIFTFTSALVFGDYCKILIIFIYTFYYIIVLILTKNFAKIISYSVLPILTLLWLFAPYYMFWIVSVILLLFCLSIKNTNLTKVYIYNALFGVLYCSIIAFGVILFEFFQMCGYSNEKRIKLNKELEVVNVLHDCGATTSYSNIVYIAPINQKFHNKDKVFSAYNATQKSLKLKL